MPRAWATCALCGMHSVPVDRALAPWPRLVAHSTNSGGWCTRGAPGIRVHGDELCLNGDDPREGCIDCTRMLYEKQTGRNPPARGDYATWYSEYLNTGSELALAIMRDAVEPLPPHVMTLVPQGSRAPAAIPAVKPPRSRNRWDNGARVVSIGAAGDFGIHLVSMIINGSPGAYYALDVPAFVTFLVIAVFLMLDWRQSRNR